MGIENNPLVANKVVDRRLLAARRAHILWLIDHQPDSDLAGAFEARIFPKDLAPFFPGDPIGYAQAKASWLAQTTRPDVNAVSLGHAADFLEVADKPLAEQMLLRARALEPKGPWAARLGRFYTSVLVGSEAPAGRNSMRTLSGRTQLWTVLWDAVAVHPWLGYGYESFWRSQNDWISLSQSQAGWQATGSHNGYIEALLSMGAAGL